jgi:hypothetical protein
MEDTTHTHCVCSTMWNVVLVDAALILSFPLSLPSFPFFSNPFQHLLPFLYSTSLTIQPLTAMPRAIDVNKTGRVRKTSASPTMSSKEGVVISVNRPKLFDGERSFHVSHDVNDGGSCAMKPRSEMRRQADPQFSSRGCITTIPPSSRA